MTPNQVDPIVNEWIAQGCPRRVRDETVCRTCGDAGKKLVRGCQGKRGVRSASIVICPGCGGSGKQRPPSEG